MKLGLKDQTWESEHFFEERLSTVKFVYEYTMPYMNASNASK